MDDVDHRLTRLSLIVGAGWRLWSARGGASNRVSVAGCRPLIKSPRALRVAGRGEDRAVVCLEDVHPVDDVGGVVLSRLKRQIKVGTEERSPEFDHEFFDRVAFGPETFGAEVARQARFVCGPVRCLVRQGGVVALGVAKGLEERQHDAVGRGPVKGTVAAVGKRGTGRAEKASARAMRADMSRRGNAGAVYCAGSPSICSTLNTM